jgi:hypothetical protein
MSIWESIWNDENIDDENEGVNPDDILGEIDAEKAAVRNQRNDDRKAKRAAKAAAKRHQRKS